MQAVVCGAIATFPVGGVAWDYAQYALGLEELGFEVFYLEDTSWTTYDPVENSYGEDPSVGVQFLQQSLDSLSETLATRWHFRGYDGSSFGLATKEINEVIAGADVFLNISGITPLSDEHMRSKRKVLIDTDPGWNHFVRFPQWDQKPVQEGRQGFRAHDYYFTYAQNIGRPGCGLPTLGIDWTGTRPPVVMGHWPQEPAGRTWTTVMTWDNYTQPIVADGREYGSKEPEFRKIEGLPRIVSAPLEVAVGGIGPPVDRWRDSGWSVIDSGSISATVEDYSEYIVRSRGEFSVAKNVYAATRSGWFSCRSACYLAAGRPVIVQETGWSDLIPSGEGLMAFGDLEEAASCIRAVEEEYERHSSAARRVAGSHFDATVVLGDLLNRIGVS